MGMRGQSRITRQRRCDCVIGKGHADSKNTSLHRYGTEGGLILAEPSRIYTIANVVESVRNKHKFHSREPARCFTEISIIASPADRVVHGLTGLIISAFFALKGYSRCRIEQRGFENPVSRWWNDDVASHKAVS